jgi:hypothetical protein
MQASCETTTGSAKCWAAVGASETHSRVGAFGEVRMCVHRETGAQRAVKVLKKSTMDEDETRMLFNEINILKELVRLRLPQPVGPPQHCEDV